MRTVFEHPPLHQGVSQAVRLALVLDGDHGLVASARLDLEGPVLHVVLDGLLTELSADESLGVEDGVDGVPSSLVLSGITDESLLLSEGDVGRSGVVSLVVGDDFDLVVLPNSNAGVGSSEINSDSRHFRVVVR